MGAGGPCGDGGGGVEGAGEGAAGSGGRRQAAAGGRVEEGGRDCVASREEEEGTGRSSALEIGRAHV